MTEMELSHELYRWLVSLDVLPNNQQYLKNGNFQLQPHLQQQLQSGYRLTHLLGTLATQHRVKLNQPLLSSIKHSNTPASSLYNWNILIDGFNKLNITITKEQQKNIVAGSTDTLLQVLMMLWKKFYSEKEEKDDNIVGSRIKEKTLDLSKITPFQQIKKSQTLLEFVLVALSQHLKLTPKQAVSTLSENGKYIAHMIVKGIKGSYTEIIALLEYLEKEMSQIVHLAEEQPEKNYELILQILKPTLISREPSVVKQGASTIEILVEESLRYNSKNLLYQILSKESDPFDFIYMGLKRHPYLNFEIWQFLYPLVETSLFTFLTPQLKHTINSDQQYLKTYLLLLEPMLQHPQAKLQLLSSHHMNDWDKKLTSYLQSKIKNKEQHAINQENKLLCLEIVGELWKGLYSDSEDKANEEIFLRVIEEYKKNTRSQIYTVKIPSMYRLFDFMDFLASQKNRLAAIIYKKIIFLFVENHQSSQLRQLILQNFTLSLRKFPTIPLEYLIEPFLKQLSSKEGRSYILNMYDFEFMLEICKHPKMDSESAISFYQLLSSLYLKSVIYSNLIFRVISVTTDRFCESEALRESCLHTTESYLNTYGMLTFGKTKGKLGIMEKKQELMINNQKKSLIIEMLKHFIDLQHRQLTEELKYRISQLYVHWYQDRSHQDQGLETLLGKMGDIEEICLETKIKKLQREEAQQITNSLPSDRNNETPSTHIKKLHEITENKSEDYMQSLGMGYKKRKIKKPNYSLGKDIKPNPRVIEDIQKVKQKWKQEKIKVQHQTEQLKKSRHKLNQKELLQRNISLGYSKLVNFSDDKIIFDYDSVKSKHLKIGLEFIDLEEQEQRDKKSVENILQRYHKYIKAFFKKYAFASVSKNRSGYIGYNTIENNQMILSFTEISRMLKEKGILHRIPKIAINQILTTINHKNNKARNILGGIYEKDFPTFLIYLTDLYFQTEKVTQKDEPFGLKLEKILYILFEDQKIARQFLDSKISEIKENLDKNDQTIIPQGYKRVDEVQVDLSYTLNGETGISSPYLDCLEVVDWILHSTLKIHAVTPYTDFIEKPSVFLVQKPVKYRLLEQSTQKALKKPLFQDDEESVNHMNEKKHKKVPKTNILNTKKRSTSNRLIKSPKKKQRDPEEQQREKKKIEERKFKLRQELERLREIKEQEKRQKQQRARREQSRKKKKEKQHQEYLKQNKRKIEEAKKKQEQKKLEQSRKKKDQEEKKKAEAKTKEVELLQREKKNIKQKYERHQQKKKQEEERQKEKDKLLNQKKPEQVLKKIKEQAQQQHLRDLEIKNSINNGQLKGVIQQYQKQLQELFESYWEWTKQRIQLRGIALMLKDFEVSPEYVPPKMMPDAYKSVSKGQLLNLAGFKQMMVKLAFKSEKVGQQYQGKEKQEKKEQKQKLDPQRVKFFFKLLKMQEQNYAHIIAKTKTHQLG